MPIGVVLLECIEITGWMQVLAEVPIVPVAWLRLALKVAEIMPIRNVLRGVSSTRTVLLAITEARPAAPTVVSTFLREIGRWFGIWSFTVVG